MNKWDSEPDRLEFEAHGFPCLIVRQERSKHLCGYVALPPGHPWFGKDDGSKWEDKWPGAPEVHGGITYGGKCHDKVCHVPKRGEPNDVWWLGFDCAHSDDLRPGDIEVEQQLNIAPWPWPRTYRDLDYVKAQCESLARQAKQAWVC
jgi:hypothetical protein